MDVKAIVAGIVTEAESFGAYASEAFTNSVNLAELESIAAQALLSGGPSAVVPALAANIDRFVSDPTVALAVKLVLKFAHVN